MVHSIGPELLKAATEVVTATGAPLRFEWIDHEPGVLPERAIESLKRTGYGLVGHFETGECTLHHACAPSFVGVISILLVEAAIGRGSKQSPNKKLYMDLDLYANVVHSFEVPGQSRCVVASSRRCCGAYQFGASFTGPHTMHKDVDIVVIRENTEGDFAGMEHEVAPGIAETIRVTSRAKTRRIAEYAFEYAFLNDRRTVTAVHKASVLKLGDGLFLESCREQARLYPSIEYRELVVDHCMMEVRQHLVIWRPDLLVTVGFLSCCSLCPGLNSSMSWSLRTCTEVCWLMVRSCIFWICAASRESLLMPFCCGSCGRVDSRSGRVWWCKSGATRLCI